jgi:hypothetical protein
MKRESGAGGRHAEGRGAGMVLFASVLLLVIGFFNMIYGIGGSRSSCPSCSWSRRAAS